MSTGPTAYYPTTRLPVIRGFIWTNYYYDNNGNTLYDDTLAKYISFVQGFTFVGPMVGGPDASYFNKNTVYGITEGDRSYTNIIKLASVSAGKRAVQPALFNAHPIYAFGDDVIYAEGSTLEGRYVYGNDLSTGETKSNAYWGPWANAGISASRDWLKKFVDACAANGATVDYLFHDNEGNIFAGATAIKAITGATLYNQTWNGLSSWKDLLDRERGYTDGPFSQSAWEAVSHIFNAKVYDLAFTDIVTNLNPKAINSDYGEYVADSTPGFTFAYLLGEDGTYSPARAMAGNAGSPVLYGFIRQADMEGTYRLGVDGSANSYQDPRRFFGAYQSYRANDPYITNETYRDRYFTTGPWTSFISCMSEMRSAKRNAPNAALTPWIANVSIGGDYHFAILDNSYWWETTDGNQALPNALHDRWLRKNVTVTKGFTSYDGTTGAFRITSNTSEEKLLSYHFNGATSGVTYVFSYYINLGTGNTAINSNVRNIKMNHFGKPKGLTYYQTLPVSTGPLFATAGISFGTSTGWTKVEFKFSLPTPDPFETNFNDTFCCSMYNSLTSGSQTTFVANPQLNIESGITYSVRDPSSILNACRYNIGCPIGFSTMEVGYNPRQGVFVGRRGGNSAYFYEMIRHCALEGTKGFGWFNPYCGVDNSITGAMEVGWGTLDFGYTKTRICMTAGFTGGTQEFLELDAVLKEINDKIGGYTTGTINPTRFVDWSLPYYCTGMPDTKGQTYWWRVTAKPGYTLYVNGVTLPNPTNGVGLWVGTTGPSISNINLSYSQHPPQPESNPSGLVKDIDFRTMNSLSDLLLAGCCFSRGSSASYIGPSGYVMFVGNNIPRFHYDPHTLKPRGLLQEGTVTNLLNWSETFGTSGGSQNNWSDTRLTRTIGNTSPANNLTAIRFTATGSDGTLISSAAIGSTGHRTLSIWMRGITGNESVSYTVDGGTSWNSVGTIGTTWSRYVFGPKYNGVTYIDHRVGFKIGSTGQAVEMWGAQLEVRGVPLYAYVQSPETSYIPTTSSTATRQYEDCYMPGITWIGNTYGTFLFETENYETDRTGQIIIISKYNPTYSEHVKNAVFAYQRSTTQTIQINNLGTQTAFKGLQLAYVHRYLVRDFSTKFMFTYSPNGIKIANNGVVISSPWSGATGAMAQNLDRISIGVGSDFNPSYKSVPATISRIRYWNYALDENTMRSMCLGGVTQDGWFNNGDGIPPQFTYYS